MKALRYLAMAAAIVFAGATQYSATAAIDKKFHDKIAGKIWSDNDSLFRPDIAIPDSLLANNSAVIISKLDDIEAYIEKVATPYKASGFTNRIRRKHLSRTMVKLLDRSAFDDFSEFEFSEKASVTSVVIIYKGEVAFGARIHYPDGTVRDVDVSEAVEVADGKKEKDNVRYKIAVPGLTEGCVLDVFKYYDEIIEELNLDKIDMPLYSSYPIMNRVIRGSFDPELTVEYKTFNGAPRLTADYSDNERTKAGLHAVMIPAIPNKKYVNANRQLPFIRMNFLNNTSSMYHPATARSGGLRANIPSGTYYRDIFSYLKDAAYDTPLPGRAAKIVRDYYLKSHPGAGARQVADAAALALRYVNATADERFSSERNVFLNLLYIDVLNRLKVYSPDSIGFAFFNPVDEVPTDGISSWTEPRFVTIVGDSCYDVSAAYHYPPGCMEALFIGQQGGAFIGDRRKLARNTLPTVVNVPQQRQGNTRLAQTATVTITPDRKVRLERSMRHTGLFKDAVAGITGRYEWIDTVEKFLCIPADKRFKAKDRDVIGRAKELRDFFREECHDLVGVTPDSVLGYSVTSRSILPGRNHVAYDVTVELPDLVEELGPDAMTFAVGRIFGNHTRLVDVERNRIFDAVLNAPYQEMRSLTIKVPEGYTIDPTSLENLAVSKRTPVGMFSVSSAVDPDSGDVTLNALLRVGTQVVPLDHWGEFLEVLDAAADFSEARLVLTKN